MRETAPGPDLPPACERGGFLLQEALGRQVMSVRLRLGSAGQSSHGVMVSRRWKTEDWKCHVSVGGRGETDLPKINHPFSIT